MKYQKLSDSSSHNEIELKEIDIESVSNPLSAGIFKLKILNKEEVIEISNLSSNSTVLDLKNEIAKASNVSCDNQRLIFQGKLLKTDTDSLASLNIVNESSIHLFPKPAPTAVAVTASPSNNGPVTVAATPVSSTLPDISGEDILALDASETSREVKLWSILLFFLSFMTVFNNFSTLSATGKLGVTTFDTIINVIDTVCSVAGIYVSQLGLSSVRTYDIEIIEKYVKRITILAIVSVLMRIFWVLDIIEVIKLELKEQRVVTTTSGDKMIDDFYTSTDDAGNSRPLNENDVKTVSVWVSSVFLL